MATNETKRRPEQKYEGEGAAELDPQESHATATLPAPDLTFALPLGVVLRLGGCCLLWGILINVRTQGFPVEHSIVMRRSMLFTSPVSTFNVVVDHRTHTLLLHLPLEAIFDRGCCNYHSSEC